MRTGIHLDRKLIGPVCAPNLKRLAAIVAASLFLSACFPFWDWDPDNGTGTGGAPPPPPPPPSRPAPTTYPDETPPPALDPSATGSMLPESTALKMCCVGNACATVDESTVSCNLDEIAKFCDENGEDCTSRGGPNF